jgi:DNA-binding NtrC family response regulator
MVVDDEPDIAKIAAKMLQSVGFHVDYFTDATQAYEQFSKDTSRYAAVLTDIRMPGINGIELVNAVHAINPDIVLILMTAFDADTYGLPPFIKPKNILSKPFGRKTVCDAVMRQLHIIA